MSSVALRLSSQIAISFDQAEFEVADTSALGTYRLAEYADPEEDPEIRDGLSFYFEFDDLEAMDFEPALIQWEVLGPDGWNDGEPYSGRSIPVDYPSWIYDHALAEAVEGEYEFTFVFIHEDEETEPVYLSATMEAGAAETGHTLEPPLDAEGNPTEPQFIDGQGNFAIPAGESEEPAGYRAIASVDGEPVSFSLFGDGPAVDIYELVPDDYTIELQAFQAEPPIGHADTFSDTTPFNVSAVRVPFAYGIGEEGPAGGRLFFVDLDADFENWDYLEAAPAGWYGDGEEPLLPWGGTAGDVENFAGAEGLELGDGEDNTAAIVDEFGEEDPAYDEYVDPDWDRDEYPAILADTLVYEHDGAEYADWFLPSFDELQLMRENLFEADIGQFEEDVYWSSSESDEDDAYRQHFPSGDAGVENKAATGFVRPIRAF